MDMEEGYRRGSVLGLTIAEIFILLVFLMLLALMGVNRYWGEKTEGWEDILENNSPEEVKTALGHPDSLREEILGLKDQIQSLVKERERLQKRIRVLVDREGETGARLDEANKKLRGMDQAIAERDRALADAAREIEALSDSTDVLKSTVSSRDDRIRILGKGINPPCWYQRVEETNPKTKANFREKPYYLFDIAIHDDYMEVQSLPIPEGGAEDDGGVTYVEEANGLELDAIPYGSPLTNMEVRSVMRPLYEKAKASQVRTYSCIFYVRVWDKSARGAKQRWKQAHDGVLEQLFGTYQVRDTRWNDRRNLPVNVRILDKR